MKIKMIEQIVDVPDEVAKAILDQQEISPDEYVIQLVKGLPGGFSFEIKIPIQYVKVD